MSAWDDASRDESRSRLSDGLIAAVEARRNDPAFMERLTASIAKHKPLLDKLAANPVTHIDWPSRLGRTQLLSDPARACIVRGSIWRGVAEGWFAGFVFEVTLATTECVVHAEVQDGDGSIVEFVHIRLADFVAAIEQGWLVAVGVQS